MQIFSENIKLSPTFNAKIIRTDYLDEGIAYAKRNANLEDKIKFLNSLKKIKRDKNINTFKIDKENPMVSIVAGKKQDYTVSIDGNCVIVPDTYMNFSSEGYKSMYSLIQFVKDAPFWKNKRNVGIEIVKKYKQLEKELAITKEKANNEINNQLDTLL